jgi:hypothetical protein
MRKRAVCDEHSSVRDVVYDEPDTTRLYARRSDAQRACHRPGRKDETPQQGFAIPKVSRGVLRWVT